MYTIDFLPEEYRRRRTAHRRQMHRLAALGAAAVLLAISSTILYWQQKDLEQQLEMIRPVHTAQGVQQQQCHLLQSHLETARSMAELLCYLRHPWPRTQILAQLLQPLPDTVTLEHLSLDCQPPDQASPSRPLTRSEQEAEKARLATMPSASRDLHRIRRECEPMQTIVRVTGSTEDAAAIHQYLGALEKEDLFIKVYLISLGKPHRPRRCDFS